MNDNLSISEILSKSFSYVFKDIKKIFRESFFTVLFLTIIFNSLYFLVLKNIATKFTFFIIFALMGLVISTIAYKVHRDILLNQTVFNPLIKMFDLTNIRYLFYSTLISSFALSPVFIKYYLDRNDISTLFGADSRYVILLLIPTIYLAFKLILILPKVSINKRISIFSGKEFNNFSGKLFLIFLIITLAFILPTYLIFTFQVYFLENSQEFYKFLKPFFDFVSFFVSYLNYAAVFAALSYAYEVTKK
ncbi:MAG: hypothetical protein EBV81_00165 [Proteobacteria bacterium]|jgi:hypothetical protein|nr:hypothetical protein [Candidatus Fonsibacter sp. PEL5]NKA16404.1 hypothetical protein [Candidatus Fonsibacter sp. PEL55]